MKLGTQKAAGMVPVDALRQAFSSMDRRESTARATASGPDPATTQTDALLLASRGPGTASTPITRGDHPDLDGSGIVPDTGHGQKSDSQPHESSPSVLDEVYPRDPQRHRLSHVSSTWHHKPDVTNHAL